MAQVSGQSTLEREARRPNSASAHPAASRPSEPRRPHAALRIRAWVNAEEYDLEEDLDHELQRRLDLIDRAIRRALATLGEDLAPPTEIPSLSTPLTPALYAVPGSSLTTPEDRRQEIGYAVVGDYWVSHLYDNRALPRIVWSVEPWDPISPARIHVLDLNRTLLAEAFAGSSLVAELRRGGRPIRHFTTLTVAELEQEAAIAAHFVRLEPVAASLSPYIGGLRAELVRRHQDSDARRDEQERVRRVMIDLDRAADMDFTRERGCTASQLRRLLSRYQAVYVDQGMPMRRAHRVLAREWGCTPKRIEALLSNARRHERIQDDWASYRDWRVHHAPASPAHAPPT